MLARQSRRALVIVLSNLRDEDDVELHSALQRLARRHRVLLVSLREEVLDQLRQRPVQSLDDALDYCGAQEPQRPPATAPSSERQRRARRPAQRPRAGAGRPLSGLEETGSL